MTVQSDYDVYVHPQWVNIPLQGLDRRVRVRTVGTVLGTHCQIRALHWHHFTSWEFTWLQKAS